MAEISILKIVTFGVHLCEEMRRFAKIRAVLASFGCFADFRIFLHLRM